MMVTDREEERTLRAKVQAAAACGDWLPRASSRLTRRSEPAKSTGGKAKQIWLTLTHIITINATLSGLTEQWVRDLANGLAWLFKIADLSHCRALHQRSRRHRHEGGGLEPFLASMPRRRQAGERG